MSKIISNPLISITKIFLVSLFGCMTLVSCAGGGDASIPTPTPTPTPTDDCVSHEFGTNQWGNGRKKVNFSSNIGAAPGSVQESCVQYTNIPDGTTYTIELQIGRPQFDYKINDGQWQSYDTESTFGNNDRIYLRTTVGTTKGSSGSVYVYVDGGATSEWQYQVENTERAPITWQVGPTRTDQQLADISNQLVAGDIVELDGDATYDGVEFTRSGIEGAPITIRGITVNGQRPVISGDLSTSKPYTLSFRDSHYYLIDNIEITGGSAVCLRNQAHEITVSNTYIHDCDAHGILGSDDYAGTLTLDHVEVANVGKAVNINSVPIKHAVYVATDPHRFPDSVLHIEHSYIHDFRGNGVKSRARRTEFLFNWVQQSLWINPDDGNDHSYYSLELIGHDGGYEPDEPLEQRVVGNVFEHIRQNSGATFGMRFGGDGTGYSKSRVWFTDNIIISPSNSGQSSIFRTQYRMNSVYMKNNVFMRADTLSTQWAPMGLFANTVDEWYTGDILIYGENNWYPAGTDLEVSSNTFSSAITTQWQQDNPGDIDDIIDVYFDSSTGAIQFPINSVLLDGSFVSSETLGTDYQVSGYSEYNNQSYQGYLQRPVVGEIP